MTREPETEQPADEETEAGRPDTVAVSGPVIPDGIDVDSLLAGMTLEEKIGQLFIVPAYGTFTTQRDREYRRLQQLVSEYDIGGIIFMRGDVYGQAMMTNHLQKISRQPLWITQDMEFGAAMRVSGATRFTPAMGIAATGDPENAYLQGKITAREAKALGVHQIYAPVLDVNNNPQNPVINVRSYSADPAIVAEFGQAFIEGAKSEGIVTTAKHFPGHGDTDTDSHLAMPVIRHSYERLDSLELVPFRAAIDNGLQSVMSAHIAFPEISRHEGLPGTLDDSILGRILVDSLRFKGLVVTDGLEMRGITENHSPGEAVILALLAGADMMVISPDVKTAIGEIRKAVGEGRISEERIDRSVRKILDLKNSQRLFENRTVDTEALADRIHTNEHQAIASRIARKSVTVLKNNRNILPIRDANHLRVLAVSVYDGEAGSSGELLAGEMRKYHNNVTYHTLDSETTVGDKTSILEAADTADLIVIGSFIRVRSYQSSQMPADHLALLQQLTSRGKPSVLVAFGNPYVVQDLQTTDVQVMAWSADEHQVRHTVPALFGASEISGTLPIDIPQMYRIGDGLHMDPSVLRFDTPEAAGMMTDSLLNIDAIMQKAIEDSVFPGGVVGVMRGGSLVWQQAYGYYDYTKTRTVAQNTVYDLASITKIMATTTSVMKLMEQGLISLDDLVSGYIPEFASGPRRRVTIEHLLLHTSGLPAFKTYVDTYKTRPEILNAIRNEPLESVPGERYVYSDLGVILLAEIVEDVTGTRIDRYIRSQFFYPMGMYSSHFNPKQVGTWISNRIPPTEIDRTFNRGTVQGNVHDERAYFMDGIAGHAGLFSTVRDMGIYSYMLLNGGYYGGRRYLNQETIRLFTGKRSPFNERGYGFDRKRTDGPGTAGTLTSDETFGHTGFTGTSIWIDPVNDLAVILLTNRTWPSRTYGGTISRIRSDIADAVINSISTYE